MDVTIDQRITAWLSTMGYDVGGQPDDVLAMMLSIEAEKWEMTPRRLAELINENDEPQRDLEPAC